MRRDCKVLQNTRIQFEDNLSIKELLDDRKNKVSSVQNFLEQTDARKLFGGYDRCYRRGSYFT